MTLADRIVVMRGGAIQQIGEPEMIYDRPANLFVAGFLGSPPMNLVPATLVSVDGKPGLVLDGQTVSLGSDLEGGAALDRAGRQVMLGIRPERIHLGAEAADADFSWEAPIDIQESLGSETLIWSRLGSTRIAIKTVARVRLGDVQSVQAGFALADASLFDADSGDRL